MLPFKSLFLSICYSIPIITSAQPAHLDSNLNLSVPIIQYQTGTQNQYFWADLEYQTQAPTPLTFIVKKYGTLDPTQLPPTLHILATVTELEPPTILDIKPTEARLHFISRIPLACSITYGLTTEFGLLALDKTMNGGAISNHNPILSHLTPDRTYYYRVQGTDKQGKIYWSPINSFKTTALNAQASNLLSINNGTTVSAVSSNYGNADNNQTWGANSTIDDSSATEWSSNEDGDKAFIELLLVKPTYINTLKVWSRSMSDGSAKIRRFSITIDNKETLEPFTLIDTQQAYEFTINRTVSRLRFNVIDSTGGNTGLIELQAY